MTSLAFAPNGSLVTGSWTGLVQRWSATTGAPLGPAAKVAQLTVSTIAFDHAGDLMAIASGGDGQASLWSTPTLRQFGSTFPGDPSAWPTARFTDNDKYLLVVDGDGHATLWPATIAAWKSHACEVAGRNFTREEWARYVTDHPYARTCPA